MKQDGYIPFNTYNRTSISVGGNFKISEKFTGGGNMSYSTTDQVGGFLEKTNIMVHLLHLQEPCS